MNRIGISILLMLTMHVLLCAHGSGYGVFPGVEKGDRVTSFSLGNIDDGHLSERERFLKQVSHFIRENKDPTVTAKEAELLQKAVSASASDLNEAIRIIRSEISKNSSPALDFALANFCYTANRFTEAEKSYKEALLKNDGFERARANLAMLLLKTDRSGEALVLFRKIIRSGRPTVDTLICLGHSLLINDEPIPAETAFRHAIMLFSDSENAWMGLLSSLLIQERHAEVASLSLHFLKENPFRQELWSVLANSYLARELNKEAIHTLEKARMLGVCDPGALFTLGDLYLGRDQFDRAAEIYTIACARKGAQESRMLRAVEALVHAGKTEQAKTLVNRIRSNRKLKGKYRNSFLFWDARISHLQKDMDRALKLYNQLAESEPMNAELMIHLGDIYTHRKEYTRALVIYERAEHDSYWKYQSLLRQASVRVKQGKYEQALNTVQGAYEIKPGVELLRYIEQLSRMSI